LDVIQRVVNTIGVKDGEMVDMLVQGRFLFAGRTLKTADPERGVFPNCTVLPLDLGLIRQVMSRTIGVGVNLDDLSATQVLESMHQLNTIP
jgi:hypothetical protein